MIDLIRNGMLVAASGIEGSLRDLVKESLSYYRLKTENVRGKISRVAEPVRMWAERPDASIMFYAGYTSKICGLLTSKGAVINSYRRLDRPDPLPYDLSRIDVTKLRPEQLKMLEALVLWEGGQLVSPTGCHAKGQGILMADGGVKRVEDIVVGDAVAGPDGSPRLVTALHRGRDDMYRVVPAQGAPFVVNQGHMLTVVGNATDARDYNKLQDISVSDVLCRGKWWKSTHKLVRSSGVSFSKKPKLPLPPYALGAVLVDGGLRHRHRKTQEALMSLGLWGKHPTTRFVPQEYRTAPSVARRELLAGLLDTARVPYGSHVNWLSESAQLAEDVVFIARSLGLAAYVTPCPTAPHNGVPGYYYRVRISGGLSQIPSRTQRSKRAAHRPIKSVLQAEFTLEAIGPGDYYGFECDKDHRYLLDDFTITHNSGKSFLSAQICKLYPTARIVLAAPTIDTAATLRRYLVEHCGEEVGQFGGGRKFSRRITSTTYDSVTKVTGIEECDILIVDEVHRSAGEEYARLFSGIQNPRKRFGLTATETGRSDKAEWMIEGLFGPVIVDIGYYESVASGSVVSLEVVVHVNPYGPPAVAIDSAKHQADKDRAALWMNRPRNELIAKDVLEMMAHLGNPQTLVLVEKTEHALALKQYLPDFEIAHGDVSEKRLEKMNKVTGMGLDMKDIVGDTNREALRGRFERGEAKKVLATSVFATGVSSNSCGLVAVASGSGASIGFRQSIGRGSRIEGGKSYAVCLLWEDTFHRAYHGRAKRLIDVANGEGHRVTRIPITTGVSSWTPPS